MDATIRAIIDQLSDSYRPFEGSEYPMPVSQALLGEMPDLGELRRWLTSASAEEVKDRLEPVAVAAEVIESRYADRERYFIDDERARSLVFTGAKWRAGWVLVAGQGITGELMSRLAAADYMIFSSQHEAICNRALPPRETGAIYFLQLMVRYAMIWGQIPPGQDHEMGHFLEQDMPGAMVVRGALGPVEGLVLLALMKMGCPAVVDTEFGYDIGPRAVARTDEEVLQALGGFPNMRVRVIGGQTIALPHGADPAHLRQEMTPTRVLTGLLQLRPGHDQAGVIVEGDPHDDHLAVIVEVTDAAMGLPASAHLEAQAVSFGSYLPGVRTTRAEGIYRVELAEGVALDPHLLGETISAGLRRKYPRLGPVQVRIALGRRALEDARAEAEALDRQRDAAILAESEETADVLHLCIDCQPFSHSHVCVISPDRPPMCGRSRNEIVAAALWGADYRPWTRRAVGGGELRHVVSKGAPIDAQAGEWAGLNAAVRGLTGGEIERVCIHALSDAPHTSCGCFGALAFRIPEGGGIGIMERGYRGLAPGGLTWSILANRAGGKQSPGVTGIALSYLKSPRVFAGEGGLSAITWATPKALEVLRPHLPPGARVASAEQVTTREQLGAFLDEA